MNARQNKQSCQAMDPRRKMSWTKLESGFPLAPIESKRPTVHEGGASGHEGAAVYQIQCDPSVPVSRNRLITGYTHAAKELNGFLRSIKAPFPRQKFQYKFAWSREPRAARIRRESLCV